MRARRTVNGGTPRQMRIRHNWPSLCHLMTKAERQAHVEGLRGYAQHLASQGKGHAAKDLERAADSFEERYPYKRKSKSRIVEWA